MTYAAIFQLEQFDFSDARVFEWGTGYSSLFWADRCKDVISIDHNEEWLSFTLEKGRENIKVIKADLDVYASCIKNFSGKFDVIVIDGDTRNRLRYYCTIYALEKLAPGGLVVLDNSDWQPNSCQLLRDNGFMQFDYAGLGPINPYAWCTSLFVKESLKFKRKPVSPGIVPGGLESVRD